MVEAGNLEDRFIVSPDLAGYCLYAGKAGFELCPSSSKNKEHDIAALIARLRKGDRFASRLSLMLPVLIEQELAEFFDGNIVVNSDRVYDLYLDEFGLSDFLPGFSPYRLKITSSGTLGFEDFKYSFEFHLGIRRIYPKLLNPFLCRNESIYILQKDAAAAIQLLRQFNKLPVEEKRDTAAALLCFGAIRQLESTDISFDPFLQSMKVLRVDSAGFACEKAESGNFELFPIFEGVPRAETKRLQRLYRRSQTVYDVTASDKTRLRIVPSSQVQKAIELISAKRPKLEDEIQTFADNLISEFSAADLLDVVDYESLSVFRQTFGKPRHESEPDSKSESERELSFGSEPDSDSGALSEPVSVHLAEDKASRDEDIDSLAELEEPKSSCLDLQSEVQFRLTGGATILSHSSETSDDDNLAAPSTVAEKLAGEWQSLDKGLVFELPASLRREISGVDLHLKSYQREGVAWLQYCLKQSLASPEATGRSGVLLADDMGLGKTLQALTFLAWTIETALPECLGRNLSSFEPILVVAPLILLPVWQKELQKFFASAGAIFAPVAVLHGDGVKKYKINGNHLDVEALCRNRLIITNYDTVKGYYHSLSKVKFSVIIADEAQEIKEANTAIAVCLKGLKRRFAIAITGTPIENKLFDLWSIMDFVEPRLLGDSKQFALDIDTKRVSAESAACNLKQRLHYGTTSAYILRRTKDGCLDGLPQKKNILRLTPLTEEQAREHSLIVQECKCSSSFHRAFEYIERLNKLYQHISLLRSDCLDLSVDSLLESSYKLSDCLDLLYEIRARREKVLLFTRRVNMQIILQKVIESHFGPVQIINGNAKSGTISNTARQRVINMFENTDGFGALILSPEVAGVGLTITAANNVVHYGRWWNPAKEAQATDRVFRLGQERDVNVYQLLSSSEQYQTFDENLHLMLARKSALAREFLVPSESMNISESDLLSDLAKAADLNPSRSDFGNTRVDSLSHTEFEALVALFWRRQGYEVSLLPNDLPERIKLVATGKNNSVAMSFLFSNSGSLREVASEHSDSLELFLERLPQNQRKVGRWISAIGCFRRISPKEKSTLPPDMTVLDLNKMEEFWRESKSTRSDIWREECNRLRSIQELVHLFSKS